jgi:hypothetical protein
MILIFLVGRSPASPAPPPRLSASAAALLRPVISEYLAHAEEFDTSGRSLGLESPHRAVFEERCERLLATKGHAADEAIAALMCFYVGEHWGEELMCETLRRGKRMVPYLRRFLHEVPVTGLEPKDGGTFTSAYPTSEEVLRRIEAGDEPCKWE